MTDTDTLIRHLATRAEPVRPLSPPLLRTLAWLGLAAVALALVVASYGLRPGIWQALATPGAGIEWGASLLTGILAGYAAFQVSVPGRSARWAWLPVPAAVLWLAGVGLGCLRDIARLGQAAFAFETASAECAWAITLVSLPLVLVLLLMVRHAGVVRPAPTALLAALSAAALSAAGVTLIHGGETAWMVLVWHLGAVLVLALLGAVFSRRLFGWIGFARR